MSRCQWQSKRGPGAGAFRTQTRLKLQGRQRYQLRASYLELYDEQITDLLAPASAAQLTIREDVCSESAKVYVEGLTEVELLNGEIHTWMLFHGCDAILNPCPSLVDQHLNCMLFGLLRPAEVALLCP